MSRFAYHFLFSVFDSARMKWYDGSTNDHWAAALLELPGSGFGAVSLALALREV
jgi:hypothetical protein